MVRLLILSANTPAPEEKNKKGMTKIAPTKARIVGADSAPLTLMSK